MSIVKYNPFWELDTISNEIDKLMEHYNCVNTFDNKTCDFLPVTNIMEDDKNIYFEVEIPGINKDDIKVSINEDNVISIRGEKKFSRSEELKTCCKSEIYYGNFSRMFQLPQKIDSSSIDAKYSDGVLHLSIGKIAPVKPEEKSIEIK